MMNILRMKKIRTVLTAVICLGVASCSTTDSDMAASNSGVSGSASADTASMPTRDNDTRTMPSAGSYGIVQTIDVVPRSLTAGVGGSVAGAAVGGNVGAASGTLGDRVYRIGVRLDDGSTKVIVQDAEPTFRVGDRVRTDNDMVTPSAY